MVLLRTQRQCDQAARGPGFCYCQPAAFSNGKRAGRLSTFRPSVTSDRPGAAVASCTCENAGVPPPGQRAVPLAAPAGARAPVLGPDGARADGTRRGDLAQLLAVNSSVSADLVPVLYQLLS